LIFFNFEILNRQQQDLAPVLSRCHRSKWKRYYSIYRQKQTEYLWKWIIFNPSIKANRVSLKMNNFQPLDKQGTVHSTYPPFFNYPHFPGVTCTFIKYMNSRVKTLRSYLFVFTRRVDLFLYGISNSTTVNESRRGRLSPLFSFPFTPDFLFQYVRSISLTRGLMCDLFAWGVDRFVRRSHNSTTVHDNDLHCFHFF
jgi:hypothetical protein